MRAERFFRQLEHRVLGPSEADREASLELAVSAKRFSERASEVLDDKLSFSAALMRAGEVEAANRMLAEVEQEVLSEEAALIEAVNEVKVARSLDPTVMSRGRLARTLALATLTSCILAFSAVGMAVAGLFRGERPVIDLNSGSEAREGASVLGTRIGRSPRYALNLAGVRLRLTDAQLQRYQQLTSGTVDEARLELFLLRVLPPEQAALIKSVLVAALDAAPSQVEQGLKHLAQAERQSRQAASQSTGQPSDDATAADNSSDDRDQEATPSPSDNPSPEPSCSPEEPEDGGGLPQDLPLLEEECKEDET